MGVRTPDPPRLPKHVPAKNAPDFTIPNRDMPKTRPVLHPNRRRRIFEGVCFCALHGYMKNLSGFIFPHPNTSKTHPVSPFPIGIHPKPARFHIPAHGCAENLPDFRPKPSARIISGRMLLRPYTGMCIIHPVSYSRTRIHQKCTRFHIFQ